MMVNDSFWHLFRSSWYLCKVERNAHKLSKATKAPWVESWAFKVFWLQGL